MANTINSQLKIAGKYVDEKLTPVNTYADLTSITSMPLTDRFIGRCVTVLNTDTFNVPQTYWLVGGKSNNSWKIKDSNYVPTYANLAQIPYNACTLGLTIVVTADETNDGKVSEYYVESLNSADKTVNWARKVSCPMIEGDDIETQEPVTELA